MIEYYCNSCEVKELWYDIIPFKKCPACGKLMFVEELDEDPNRT
jgi:hypothetical protein